MVNKNFEFQIKVGLDGKSAIAGSKEITQQFKTLQEQVKKLEGNLNKLKAQFGQAGSAGQFQKLATASADTAKSSAVIADNLSKAAAAAASAAKGVQAVAKQPVRSRGADRPFGEGVTVPTSRQKGLLVQLQQETEKLRALQLDRLTALKAFNAGLRDQNRLLVEQQRAASGGAQSQAANAIAREKLKLETQIEQIRRTSADKDLISQKAKLAVLKEQLTAAQKTATAQTRFAESVKGAKFAVGGAQKAPLRGGFLGEPAAAVAKARELTAVQQEANAIARERLKLETQIQQIRRTSADKDLISQKAKLAVLKEQLTAAQKTATAQARFAESVKGAKFAVGSAQKAPLRGGFLGEPAAAVAKARELTAVQQAANAIAREKLKLETQIEQIRRTSGDKELLNQRAVLSLQREKLLASKGKAPEGARGRQHPSSGQCWAGDIHSSDCAPRVFSGVRGPSRSYRGSPEETCSVE
jgi:hypothetical protein